ncbi:HAD family hydrolase [Halalkalicoccus jeotgali]|uniref:HAD superfamily hydrolase n=1 Tax=Halalkalicoccus jeotgali (strain DSM 18796 / CECT 7217 / JCM 14584 / KCTC 4019 / B3) TaxID=795797 RepID=D8J3S2_HALJB|nr:HAD family phosphatase [Halalkalicoccus jeotgali]ADJ13413.1 HAD-superfamily hydrolase, subfamily IA, variant 3 [Halalkalicoccus jeotgali B3]ELY32755.1 HAD superfamily hydrolase [Halalkalicoccus jeotgali B3]
MDVVLFDMDGVIVDSEDYWVEREREELLPAVVEEDVPVSEITGMNYKEIYEYLDSNYTTLVERSEYIDRFEALAEEIYTEHAELMPGFRDLLEALHERGVRTAIVSSSPPDWIGTVTDRFDLAGFDEIVSAEHIDGPGKPEPAIYEHAAGEMDVSPAECVVVEDSEHGVEAAAAAGAYTIAYGTATNDEHDHSAADEHVSGPEELRERLLALCNPD